MSAAALAAGLSAAVPAQAVSGGEPAAEFAYPYVARVTMLAPGAEGARSCTGVLVAPRWVLTAKGCFTADTEPASAPAPSWPVVASFAAASSTVAAQQISSAGIKYDNARGLALVALSRPVAGIAPVPLSATAPVAGDAVTVAGYGRTATEWVPARPHTAGFQLAGVAGGAATLTSGDPADGLCRGDAGGPALRDAGAGQLQLVAVVTSSFQRGCLAETAADATAGASVVTDLASLFNGDPFGQLTLTPTESGSAAVAGASFGAATAMGDFNKDGFLDLAVGAPADHVNGAASGTVTVFSGTATGLGASRRIVQTEVGAADEADDRFGAALAAGDFNKDGYADLAIGAPNEAIGTTRSGAIAVFSGSATGLGNGKGFDQDNLSSGRSNEAGDQWGTALAAGDFNNDGFADLAIGAPNEALAGTTARSGDVTVYKGGAAGFAYGWTIHQSEVGGADEAGDRFGAALAAGNVTGSAHQDLIIGAPGESPNADPQSGGVYVSPGAASGYSAGFGVNQGSLDIGANEAGDEFGAALAVGNFDKDAYADIAVGIPGEFPGSQPKSGSVGIVHGASSRVGSAFVRNEDHFQLSFGVDDRFGVAVATGDTDGDGFADLLIGAPGRSNGSAVRAGMAVIARGQARTSAQPQSLAAVGVITQAKVYGTDETNDRFGSAVALGDVNKDGRADAVIGSSGEALPGGPAAGAVMALLKPLVTAGPPAPPGTPPATVGSSLVETYAYPGAAAIEQEQGVKLIRGNGRIMLTTCDEATDLIIVETLDRGQVCFRAQGAGGLLTVEIPDVYLIRGGDEDITATVTHDGASAEYEVAEGEWASVITGEGTFAVLLEIQAD
jgi:hypothetical protein